jgi:hypothetical protein
MSPVRESEYPGGTFSLVASAPAALKAALTQASETAITITPEAADRANL